MDKTLLSYQQYIQTLSLTEDEKQELLNFGQQFRRAQERLDFKFKRTLQDKSIVINLLNRTIEELRTQQKEVEAANTELKQQKKLVEAQSEKLAEQLHLLEKSYVELEQFSYIASHDLKSPLRTIASYAALLRRHYVEQLGTPAIEYVAYIIKSAGHMNEIIRDLLEYAAVGKENNIEALDINEIIGLVLLNLSSEINETQAIIEFQTLPVIMAHRTGVLQLFQNLIANSIKFSGDRKPEIRIEHESFDEHWHFTISDNGLGIDEVYQEKAFMPFQRIAHLDRPGTGMGLAICKKIVKAHGGDIWFESVPSQGTSFHFTIQKIGQ